MGKKPFSGKQKRQQLQEKRERKLVGASSSSERNCSNDEKPIVTFGSGIPDLVQSFGHQVPTANNSHRRVDKTANKRSNPTIATSSENELKSLVSTFARESREEILRRKSLSQLPFERLPQPDCRTMSWDEWNLRGNDGTNFIELPRRLEFAASHNPRKAVNDSREHVIKWLQQLYLTPFASQLNCFEHNPSVWCELLDALAWSNMAVLVADARHPGFHVPRALYQRVVVDLRMPMILVLNKVDLVSESHLQRWESFFHFEFPDLHITRFSNRAWDLEAMQNYGPLADVICTKRSHRKLKRRNPVGVEELMHTIENVGRSSGLWSSDQDVFKYETKFVDEECNEKNNDEKVKDKNSHDSSIVAISNNEGSHKNSDNSDSMKQTPLKVAFIGHPNVGKSSLINGLVGRHAVSTSATPGHTKHCQTIVLSPNVTLYDSPGLIFPAVGMPRAQQVVAATLPIAQVQEPFSCVQYVAERLPIHIARLYKLVHTSIIYEHSDLCQAAKNYTLNGDKTDEECDARRWSAWDICESYALKRGFFTAKGGRADVHRGANQLLRDVANGVVILTCRPPPMSNSTDKFDVDVSYSVPVDVDIGSDSDGDDNDVDDVDVVNDDEIDSDGVHSDYVDEVRDEDNIEDVDSANAVDEVGNVEGNKIIYVNYNNEDMKNRVIHDQDVAPIRGPQNRNAFALLLNDSDNDDC